MKLSQAQRKVLEQMRDGRALGHYESPAHPFRDRGYRWEGEYKYLPSSTIKILLQRNLVRQQQAQWGRWTTPLELTDEGIKALEG